jgi:ferredoxin
LTDNRLPAGLSPVREGQALPQGTITYRSRGAVLVIGDDDGAVAVARGLPAPLVPVVFAPGAAGELRASPRVVGGRITCVEGHLGAFRASALTATGEAGIGAYSPNDSGAFDLVLDLGREPRFARSVLPPGYLAPGIDEAARIEALVILGRLVGTFAKPRHFTYDPDNCAHGARGVAGCTRCLPACAAGAIHPAGDRIAVDPFLCQGCAACTLACPTGALSFASPSREEGLAAIEAACCAAREAHGSFALVVHGAADREAVNAAAAGRPWALVEAEPLAAFGEESWLAALALGAGAVLLVRDSRVPPETDAILRMQVAATCALFGHTAPVRVKLVDAASLPAVPASLRRIGRDVAMQLKGASKRGLLHEALGALGLPPARLAPGATLGAVLVADAKCTLCSACANVCPTGALAFVAQPEATLSFLEDACVQCGLCAAACPEAAVTLDPRLADSATRSARRALVTGETARCPSCGSGFAPKRLLRASLARFGDEAGLGEAGRERLRLCPACRQESMFRQS